MHTESFRLRRIIPGRAGSAFLLHLGLGVLLSGCGQPAAAPPAATTPAVEEAAPRVTGLTTRVEGTVEILLPGEETWKPLQSKEPLPVGARIRTGANAEADLLLAERSAVRVKPGSELLIAENRLVGDTSQIEIKLDAGRLLHRFDRRGAGVSYRIATPSCVAGIRGTQFEIAARAERTDVRVLTGRVEVENAAGRVGLAEKEGTSVAPGAAPPAPSRLAQADIDALLECSLIKFTVALQRSRRMASAAEMRNLVPELDVYAATHDGLYPPTLQEAGVAHMTDNWNQPYRYEQLESGRSFRIISNGPDGAPDTEDDLEYSR